MPTWTGDGDQRTWSDSANWDTNQVPTPEDDVTIGRLPDGSAAMVVAAGEDIRVNALTLLEGASLSGAVTATQGFTWTGGEINGTVNLAAGCRATIGGEATKVLGGDAGADAPGVINNAGTVAAQGPGPIHLGGTAVFNNRGTFTASGDLTFTGLTSPTSATFNNEGTFVVSSPAGSVAPPTVTFGIPCTNSGTLEVVGSTVQVTDGACLTQTAGSTRLVGGTLASTASVNIQGGTLSGSGTIEADVSNAGTIQPRDPPGVLRITGDYRQSAAGTLAVEIAGATAAPRFGQLAITGAAVLDGLLRVSLVNGFQPGLGETFTIVVCGSLQERFATLDDSALRSPHFFGALYSSSELTLSTLVPLRRGDHDAVAAVYGGEQVPVPGQPLVRQLQQDLAELGFWLVGPPDGVFGLPLEWAVREFQIYARMPFVARQQEEPVPAGQYLASLTQVENPPRVRYPADQPISGVANRATCAALQHWKRSRWRCPVVVTALRQDADGNWTSVEAENLWLHDVVRTPSPRMFARDFSGYYQQDPDQPIVVGEWHQVGDWDGPRSMAPQHTWAERTEMVPSNLVGPRVQLGDLSPAQRSTFKVIRAVAEQECLACFDSVNAWDRAFVSLGCYHWALGFAAGPAATAPVGEGELGGYLAYLRAADPAAFATAIQFFGLSTTKTWGTDGTALFNAGQRKYTAWLAVEQEGGGYAGLEQTVEAANYVRTWHWFYRWVMAGRTVDGFRLRMWDMARLRLRDLQRTPWDWVQDSTPVVPDAGTRPATVGDVFSSERAMALVLRWHVWRPANMVSDGRAGPELQHTFDQARTGAPQLAWSTDPTTWGQAHEDALLDGLRARIDAVVAGAGAHATFQSVDRWPDWAGPTGPNPRHYTLDPTIGGLLTGRGSFQLDDTGLSSPP